MAKSYDLRREVQVAKMQALIDAVNLVDRPELAPNCTTTNVPASLTEVTLQAANVLRNEVVIHNNTNGILYVLCGSGVTSSNYNWRLKRGDHLTVDKFRGQLTGIFTSATGFAMVTEEYY